jgi:phosphatidylglycerol:prolipoprotein diacylglycerol transferase
MLPQPFDVGPYHVTLYEVARLVSIVAAVSLALVLNRRQGIAPVVTLSISVLGVVAGHVGARLLDTIEYARPFAFRALLGEGGSSIYGGLILSFVVVAVGATLFGVSVGRFFDGCAPAVSLAEATTRLGCFFAGCCYGTAWAGPLAVSFPPQSVAFIQQVKRGLLPPDAPHSLAVHPVQLYSVGLALLITIFLLLLFRRRHYPGDVFFAFLISYGCLRLLVAPVRVEKLRSMTMFSVLFVLCGVIGIVARRLGSGSKRADTAP